MRKGESAVLLWFYQWQSDDNEDLARRAATDQSCRGKSRKLFHPVNSDYAKEDAIHPETPALEFHLDHQSVFAN